jgi:hypothetical protein
MEKTVQSQNERNTIEPVGVGGNCHGKRDDPTAEESESERDC